MKFMRVSEWRIMTKLLLPLLCVSCVTPCPNHCLVEHRHKEREKEAGREVEKDGERTDGNEKRVN